VEVLDLHGRQHPVRRQGNELDLQGLPAGAYLLRVQTEAGWSQRLILLQ